MERSLFDKYLGNALYEARVVKRITQEDLTTRANYIWKAKYNRKRQRDCTRATYTRYEKGEFSMPMGFYKAACEVLDLDWKKVFKEAQNYELNHIDEISND